MKIWKGCGNGSTMGTYVLAFEYLDVNRIPHIGS